MIHHELRRARHFLPALVLLSCPAAAQTFSDATFLDTDWSLTTDPFGAGGSCTASQVSLGNPLPARDVRNNVTAGSTHSGIFAYHLKDTAVHSPLIDGSIGAIDFSIDYLNRTTCATGGDGQGFGPCLSQGGKFYVVGGFVSGTTSTWQTGAVSGLTEDSFYRWDPVMKTYFPDEHPTFSAAEGGGPITFGFHTRNSSSITGGAGSSRCVAYDNWSVTVHVDSTPPTILCPSFVSVPDYRFNGPGEIVYFPTLAVIDDFDPSPTVVCTPPSGSHFRRGVTAVTCTATDASGNSKSCVFYVIVEKKRVRLY